MFMTDLCYIKCNDFLRFETLECFEIVLKFHYFLRGPLLSEKSGYVNFDLHYLQTLIY